MGWHSVWIAASYHVVALCFSTELQERGKHWDKNHSPPQCGAPLLTVGANSARNGLGMIREEGGGGGGRSPSRLVVGLQRLKSLLMDNSLMNYWICFVFHCMLDLQTVLTNEIMGFLTKITCMSLLVHSKQHGFIVNLYAV